MIRLGSRSKSTEVVADGHADMAKKLLLVNSGQIGRMKHGPLRSLSSLRFFPPFPPCYHALNSCFFAQIWVIVRMPASSGKFRTSVSSFFRWREKAEISRPWFWIQPGIGGSNRTHLFLVFLRASVPPWCKDLVFGCSFVAPCFRFAFVFFDTCQGQSPKLWPPSPLCYACEEFADTPLSHARYSPES